MLLRVDLRIFVSPARGFACAGQVFWGNHHDSASFDTPQAPPQPDDDFGKDLPLEFKCLRNARGKHEPAK